MLVYAIVPARGGSKGIIGKNLRPVEGVPLVARAVHAARSAHSVTRVFVTTDSDAIAEVARDAGAEVIDRPAELAGDAASSDSAVLHVLEILQHRREPAPTVVVMAQCTSPFLAPGDIDGVVDLVACGGADSAFTAARTQQFLWRDGADGMEPLNHDAAFRPRRQDVDVQYVETGAAYAMRADGFLVARHRFFGTIRCHEVPAARALEIDEPDDLALAVAIAPTLERGAAVALPSNVAGLALDFDGVLTDNRVLTIDDGREAVLCDRSDGLAVRMLREAGIPMVVLSTESNSVVSARCAKLSLDCVQALEDKAAAFQAWMASNRLAPEDVVFVGNDLNDLECLRIAGCGIAVADAHTEVRAAADFVLACRGGRGALRELATLITAPSGRV